MLVDPYQRISTNPDSNYDRSILYGSGIIQKRTNLSNGAILIDYILPESGHIFHYVSNEKYNEMPDLFLKEFQEIDNMNLKRHVLRRVSNRVGSSLVARQFTINVGTHYSHALDLNSVSWSDAPKVCRDTFGYIQNIVKDFIPNASFNEIMSMIYMEGQRMSWHDDGEKEVGPVIATLSLGSSAEMKFRRKQKKGDNKRVKKAKPININGVSNLKTTNRKRKTKGDDSKRERKKVLENVVESTESKTKQIVENAMDGQLLPFKNLSTPEKDILSGFSSIISKIDDQLLPSANLPTPEKDTLSGFSSVVPKLGESISFFPTNTINASKASTKRRTSGPELSLILRHGDLVIMSGKVLQENYEHTVVPKGFRIASTIRHINRHTEPEPFFI